MPEKEVPIYAGVDTRKIEYISKLSYIQEGSGFTKEIICVESDLEEHLVSSPLPQAGGLYTSPACSEPHLETGSDVASPASLTTCITTLTVEISTSYLI